MNFLEWDTEAWKPRSEGVALTILIVDDEPAVLSYIATIVRKEGYEVLQADGGDEALAICESHACCFDLMISDVAMPRMNWSRPCWMHESEIPRRANRFRVRVPGIPRDSSWADGSGV